MGAACKDAAIFSGFCSLFLFTLKSNRVRLKKPKLKTSKITLKNSLHELNRQRGNR
jgi:hypothetical protein